MSASSQQTTTSNVLAVPHQHVIYSRSNYKNKINKFTVTSKAISFFPSLNKTPPSPPYHFGSKIKSVPEEKYNEELPAGIEDYSYYYPLVVYYYLKMGDMSGGNFSLNNHSLSQQYFYSNNGDLSSGYGF